MPEDGAQPLAAAGDRRGSATGGFRSTEPAPGFYQACGYRRSVLVITMSTHSNFKRGERRGLFVAVQPGRLNSICYCLPTETAGRTRIDGSRFINSNLVFDLPTGPPI